jgi:hypothetical protein
MGDYNINLLNTNSHSQTSIFVDNLFENNLFPAISKPTRVTSKSATLIDNIFYRPLINTKMFFGILYSDISDHYPIFLIDHSLCLKPEQNFITVRDLSLNNKRIFKEKLDLISWDDVLQNNNPEDAFQLFHETFTTIYNDCFPLKHIKLGYRTRKPWLTAGLKISIKRKNRLYYKMIQNPTHENKITYKQFRNRLHYFLRKVERDHYASLLDSNKFNLRKTWNILKEIINKRNNSNMPECLIINNKSISNKNDMANAFNKYFVNIGTALSNKIPVTRDKPCNKR